MAQFIETTGNVLKYKITSLENTQKAIGGWLETVHLGGNEFLLIDEEGKLKGLPRNVRATILASKVLGPHDYIAGPAILTTREEFENGSPDDFEGVEIITREPESNYEMQMREQREYEEECRAEQEVNGVPIYNPGPTDQLLMDFVEKEKKVWTKDEIKEKISNDNKWLERAILAIYEKQTAQEQNSSHTILNNGVGFNGPDSNKLSYMARWIKSGKHLSGSFLEDAKSRMQKYAGQLTKIANKEL